MGDRFFDDRRMNNKTIGNLTRYNSSINETIKSIEEKDRRNFDWKKLGINFAVAVGAGVGIYGGHTLVKYALDRRAEQQNQEEIPPVVEVEVAGNFRL